MAIFEITKLQQFPELDYYLKLAFFPSESKISVAEIDEIGFVDRSERHIWVVVLE